MTYLREQLSFPCFLQRMFSHVKEKTPLQSRLRLAGLLGLCWTEFRFCRCSWGAWAASGLGMQVWVCRGMGSSCFFQCLFPVWGAPGFCWEQDDASRLPQGCSAELASGILNWLSVTHLPNSCCLSLGVSLDAWQEILAQIQPRVQLLIWHLTSLSKGAGMQGGLSWPTLQGRAQDAAQPMAAGTYWLQKSDRNTNPEVYPHLCCFSLYRPFYNKNFNNSKVKIKFLILHLFFFLRNLTKSLPTGSRASVSV